MLGQVPGNYQDQFIESVEVRDLSMGTNNKARDNADQAEFLKELDRSPKRCLATPWLLCNGRLLRVDITIVRPKTEKAKYYLSLGCSEPQGILKAITDIVKLLEEELRCQHPVS